MTKEQNARGGYNQSQKIYFCSKCNGISSGNRFVSDHLAKECNGIQKRKTKASTKKNAHRLEEAQINTELWYKEKVNAELYAEFKVAKQRIIDSIEEMRAIFGAEFQATLETYYKQIF